MLHTPTSQPLFIRHKSAAELLEKQAAAVARMPDDDKRWPAQVLSEMHKQLPFLSKFDVDIEMTRIEPEAGYALGYAMLRNKTGKQRAAEELGKPTNKIRVPVIVADRLLQPFHVFEVGGKTYPLTQERVESAMMNPSMFDGISDPPGTQSLLDQIYPPFQHRQGYGMMSGDRATTGLSKLSSAPRVTKTASGESGPLREFLRQQEVEKTAIFTPQAVAKGVPGAVKSFENLAARRVLPVSRGGIAPPVRPPPVSRSAPEPFIPPKVKITDKLTGTTRSIQNGSNGFLLPSARPSPVKTLRDTTLTDLPGTTALGGQQVTVPRIDPRFSNFNGPLPPARSSGGPLTAGHSTEDLMAAASGGPGAAQRVVEATPVAPVTTSKLTQRTLPEIQAQAAEIDKFRRLSGTAEREAVEKAVAAERSAVRARQIRESGSLAAPEARAAREAAPASLAAKAQEIQASSAATAPRRPLPEGTTFTPVNNPPGPGRLAAKANEIRAPKAAPSPEPREVSAPVREAPVSVSEGAAGAGNTVPEINPSAAGGSTSPAQMTRQQQLAHDYHMTSQNLPKMSPEAYQELEQAAQLATQRTGTKVTAAQMYQYQNPAAAAPAAPAPGFFNRALSSAAGGATMLGLGAIGGGMMMANKASENY